MTFNFYLRTRIGFHPFGIPAERLAAVLRNHPTVICEEHVAQACCHCRRLFLSHFLHLASSATRIRFGQQCSAASVAAKSFLGRVLIQSLQPSARSPRLHSRVGKAPDTRFSFHSSETPGTAHGSGALSLGLLRGLISRRLNSFLRTSWDTGQSDRCRQCNINGDGCLSHVPSPPCSRLSLSLRSPCQRTCLRRRGPGRGAIVCAVEGQSFQILSICSINHINVAFPIRRGTEDEMSPVWRPRW